MTVRAPLEKRRHRWLKPRRTTGRSLTGRAGIYLFIIAFTFFSSAADAQLTVGGVSVGGIEITVSPQYPSPGDLVRLSAGSFTFDIDRSRITWLANGKIIAEGPGSKEANIIAGPLGSEMDIQVIAQGENGASAGGGVMIRPTELDLLWESDSYIPAFYRGRALPSAGTMVRLQVIPRFKRGDEQILPRDLVFTWRRNGSVLPSVSGRGRSSADLPSPVLFGTDIIAVRAESLDGGLVGGAEVQISSVEPLLALYQDHPLFGMTFHQALSAQTVISDSEMTFAAIPYFAQVESPDDDQLLYSWKVNGLAIETDLNRPSELTVNAEKSTGIALIELALTQANNLIMRAGGRWGVQFSAKSEGGADPFNAQ